MWPDCRQFHSSGLIISKQRLSKDVNFLDRNSVLYARCKLPLGESEGAVNTVKYFGLDQFGSEEG
jgi:hypothetical protein